MTIMTMAGAEAGAGAGAGAGDGAIMAMVGAGAIDDATGATGAGAMGTAMDMVNGTKDATEASTTAMVQEF